MFDKSLQYSNLSLPDFDKKALLLLLRILQLCIAGGLAGVPFPGKTGFNAFSHHVPKDGRLLVALVSVSLACSVLQFDDFFRAARGCFPRR